MSAQKKKKRNIGPESRDRHKLYELAVQSPDVNVQFFDRLYRKANGRLPKSLKEDFCGTALLSAEWVRTRPDNTAMGVDLDVPTLEWGTKHNLEPLGDDASRVTLVSDDVRAVTKPKVDIVVALNFSYFIFKTRQDLLGYFKKARASLKPGGMFFLDIFGGWEAQQDLVDKTRQKGFTYLWEQKGFNPVTNEGLFYIHFNFHGGGGIRKAFVYDWRLWTIPEVKELLVEAGFKKADVYWEGVDDDGEGNGIFRRVERAENCPGWHTFMVGS